MSDNVYELFPNGVPKKETPAPSISGMPSSDLLKKTQDVLDSLKERFPNVAGETMVRLGDKYTMALTRDGFLVVLYGTGESVPVHLRDAVAVNRPVQEWEAILVSGYSSALAQLWEAKMQLAGLHTPVNNPVAPGDEKPTGPIAGLERQNKNINATIGTRVVNPNTMTWPDGYRHETPTFFEKGAVPISKYGAGYVLYQGTTSERGVFAMMAPAVDDVKCTLLVLFVKHVHLGGMTRTLGSACKTYNADAYLTPNFNAVDAAIIAGGSHKEGYAEMQDITKFFATGEFPEHAK